MWTTATRRRTWWKMWWRAARAPDDMEGVVGVVGVAGVAGVAGVVDAADAGDAGVGEAGAPARMPAAIRVAVSRVVSTVMDSQAAMVQARRRLQAQAYRLACLSQLQARCHQSLRRRQARHCHVHVPHQARRR